MKRVIVIGLDGFEPSVAELLLNAGELPHLAELSRQGGYARLQTTTPAQTPVAWSTFATGVNPGGHGVFDFIGRNPQTYLPELSFTRYEQKNMFLPPKAVNMRRGVPLWRLLADSGWPSTVVRFPCTYPPDEMSKEFDESDSRMLSGMGVPDLRGGQGTSTFYSSDGEIVRGEGEHVIPVTITGSGEIRTHLIGPRDPKTGADIRSEITLRLDRRRRTVTLLSDGEPAALVIEEGKWSDWLRVKFKTGLFQSARGIVRFYLSQIDPVFELYASPINFDPRAPLFPISSPPGYAGELAAQIGTFYTAGMVEDHNGLNNGRISDEAFLKQCDDALAERTRMMIYELERFEAGLFFCLFDTPDRVHHMFKRDGQRVVEEHYRSCDAIIGRVMEYVDEETLLIVLSDHGMNSFERGFNLNTWLHDQGLLAIQSGFSPGADAGDLLRAVDWSRTKAYALGLSGIYLNLKGREERGIVERGEAADLTAAIARELAGLGDPARNTVAIRSVKTRDQLYRGAYADEAADLVVNYAGGYRVSWATSLGGIPATQFEDNLKKWSGDHLIDPELVPGVLLMNRRFNALSEVGARPPSLPSLIDLAPTILAALGVPIGEAMEGDSLLR